MYARVVLVHEPGFGWRPVEKTVPVGLDKTAAWFTEERDRLTRAGVIDPDAWRLLYEEYAERRSPQRG